MGNEGQRRAGSAKQENGRVALPSEKSMGISASRATRDSSRGIQDASSLVWVKGNKSFEMSPFPRIPRNTMTTHKTILTTVLALAGLTLPCFSAPAQARNCDRDQWYSSRYDICFDKDGRCNQYDYTDHRTCNSGRDNLRCDWDSEFQVCEPENGRCASGDWYSSKYHTCFEKEGWCDQYDFTDSKTCNTNKDKLRCDWDRRTKRCYAEEESFCERDEWYSPRYDACFVKTGPCSQYDFTDSQTCNTGKDHIRCDWDSSDRSCYREP